MKIGDKLFKVEYLYGIGGNTISISQVLIVGETPKRWKLANHDVIKKEDLSRVGGYNTRRYSYQENITSEQETQLCKQKKKQRNRKLYEVFVNDVSKNGKVPRIILDILEDMYGDKI